MQKRKRIFLPFFNASKRHRRGFLADWCLDLRSPWICVVFPSIFPEISEFVQGIFSGISIVPNPIFVFGCEIHSFKRIESPWIR
ncbi:hypothetical protein DLM75_04685 [Leptospira stimsonii]|uniref:Uncharacterized protein n=1 Tax=Leptospira stimsonii TaxID=2202203 RepID=A0A396ZFF2_9LEPT|nr:hypothetical protein DLM75_04685 [Leptospira stimsonii]